MSSFIVEYQESFADNLTNIAYAKILQNKTDDKFFFVNNPLKRKKFERDMENFSLDFSYLSKNQVQLITSKSYKFTRKLIKENKILKNIRLNIKKNKALNIRHFSINDISSIPNDLFKDFKFKNTDFIINYDYLDEIKSSNSIGLFIDKKDAHNIDYNFILKSVLRLNKYLKRPVLYIFSKGKNNIDLSQMPIKTKFVNIADWREEFYLLTNCRNKIILMNDNSYSAGFWSSILNQKTYLVAFDRKINPKNYPDNWIKI